MATAQQSLLAMQASQHQVQQLAAQFLLLVHKLLYVYPNDVIYGISAAASATGAIVITYSA
jgi:hypothetical protein